MRHLAFIVIGIACLGSIGMSPVRAQALADTLAERRIFSEGRLLYKIELQGAKDTALIGLFAQASLEVWMRGSQVRTDFLSPLRNLYTYYNSSSQSGTIIKESNNDRYITSLNKSQWRSYFTDRQVNSYTPEKDTVLQGYFCKKVLANLTNGNQVQIYYTPAIIPFVKDYDLLLEGLEGVAVRYSYAYQDYTVVYQLQKIESIPVSNSRFELPQIDFKKLEYTGD